MANTIQTKYAVGDSVWVADFTSGPQMVTCPDCLGERVWACTLPSGEALNIPCPTCNYGWDGSRGVVNDGYAYTPKVWQGVVGSVKVDTFDGDTDYMLVETGVGSGRNWSESVLFQSREEAELEASRLANERQEQMRVQNIEARHRKKKDRPGSLVAYLRSEVTNKRKEIERTLAHIANLQKQHPRMKEPQS